MNLGKKLVSMLLCVLLTANLFAPVIFAADEDPANPIDSTGQGTWDGFDDQPQDLQDETLTPAEKEALLNAEPLDAPLYTHYQPLDTLVAQILSDITTAGMSTYQKTKAVYHYLMQGTSYIPGNTTTESLYYNIWQDVSYNSPYDRNLVCQAYGLLADQYGVCNHFAAAFIVFARAIGLKGYLITCGNSTPNHGTGDHSAAVLELGGGLYIFDPVMGVVLGDRESVETSDYFCQPLHSSSQREFCHFEEQLSFFGNFETGPITKPPTEEIPGATDGEVYFNFGSYPQSRVTDEALIAALNTALKTKLGETSDGKIDTAKMRSYGYYVGDGTPGTQRQGDYMRYVDMDFAYNGKTATYRAVTFDSYRPIYTYYTSNDDLSYQNEAGYEPGNIYWFCFEPIEWRLVDGNNLLVADLALDSQPFNSVLYEGDPLVINGKTHYLFADESCTKPVNNWGTSQIRGWLNGSFKNTAFSANEQALLCETELTNYGILDHFNYANTTDCVFLLSRNEVTKSDYYFAEGKNARQTTSTDYAQIQGISVDYKSGSYRVPWLQRSAGFHSGDASLMSNSGGEMGHLNVAATMLGVRPAIRISDMNALIPQTLSAPSKITARATGTGQITLRSAISNGATMYEFTCLQEGAIEPVCVKRVSSPRLVLDNLAPGQNYMFQVRALRDTVDGEETTPSIATDYVLCRHFVTAPTQLAAEATDTGVITLSWEPVDGAETYHVYRYLDAETLELCGESDTFSCSVPDLTTGSLYWFRVTSVSADGYESDYSQDIVTCRCESVPAKPIGVQAESTATGEITVTWNDVPQADHYRVYRYTGLLTKKEIGDTDNTSFTERGLAVGHIYYYTVVAEADEGAHVSAFSHVTSAMCESFPPVPQGLTAEATATGEITLSWESVEGAVAYEIERVSGDGYLVLGTTETTDFTATGFSVGHSYHFRVTAISEDGLSRSAPAVVQATAQSIPAVPTGVTVTPTATKILTVSWKPVEGAAIYRVYRYTVTSERELVGETGALSLSDTNCAVGSEYAYCVTAITADGTHESDYSSAARGVAISIPPVPTGVTAESTATGVITLTWTPVDGAAGYRVYRYTSATAYEPIGETTECTFVDAGRAIGTKYAYRVSAVNGSDESVLTNAIYCTAASVPAMPTGVTAESTATGIITLTWTPVDGAAEYRVYRYISATAYEPIGETAECTFVDAGRAIGTKYAYRVSAVNGSDESVLTNTVYCTAASIPAMPTDVIAESTATKEITVSWQAVEGAGMYRVYRYNSATTYVLIGETSQTFFTDVGRKIGEGYAYRVSAVLSDGAHESVVSAIARATSVSIPAQPESFAAVALSTGAITLTWQSVADAGLYQIAQYGPDKVYHEIGETEGLTYTVSGLSLNSRYYFRLIAVTADGRSESSPVYADALCKQFAVTPDAPASLTAVPNGDGSVVLTWSASEGATQYNISRSRANENRFSYITTATSCTYTETGLPVGETYVYRVTPVSKGSVGTFVGNPSPDAVVTVLGTPAAPGNLSVVPSGDGALTLSWNAVPGATQYNIYRYRGDKNTYVYIGTSYSSVYTCSGFSGGTAYYFKVLAAVKGSGFTFVGPMSVAANAKAISSPAKSAGLKATASGDGQITLTWDKTNGATQYNVYRYRGDVKQYVYLGTSYTQTYIAKNLAGGTSYYFKVMAVIKSNGLTLTGPMSDAVNTKAVSAPAVPSGIKVNATGEGELTLTWNKTSGATQYNVYRYRGDTKQYVYLGTSYTQTYIAKNLTGGTSYYFKVMAVIKSNGLTLTGPMSAAVNTKALGTPATPTGLKVVSNGGGQMTLTWNSSYGATQYNVYRYRGDVKQYVYIGTSYTPTYICKGLTVGTNYYFKVCPVVKGNGLTFVGAYSAAVNAKA